MKKSKKGLLIALAIVAVLAIGAALWFALGSGSGRPGESLRLTVEVIHKDGSSREFALETEKRTLGDALVEGKVVEDNQGPYGLYILTADGETADADREEWWSISKDGEPLTVGAGEQPIAEGEHYELTFSVGFDKM